MKPDERCGHKGGCTHPERVHRPKRGTIPAYCSKCKHGKGAHQFVPRTAVAA